MLQFELALGQREVEALFSLARTLNQELQSKGGFAGPRIAFYEIQKASGQSPLQYVVQPGNSRRKTPLVLVLHAPLSSPWFCRSPDLRSRPRTPGLRGQWSRAGGRG